MVCSRERCEKGTDRNLEWTPWAPEWAPWHLNGQPQEPKMGAFWSLKLLPMVPTSHSLVTDLHLCCHTWSENGHPYVARTLWSWDLATPWVRTGFLEARSGSLRKRLTAVPKIPLLWLPLRPSGVRIDFIGIRSCILPQAVHTHPTSTTVHPQVFIPTSIYGQPVRSWLE
jgi:hypothetical protein